MKGRPLILIFLFFILVQTVCAESHTGVVDLQLSEDAPDWSLLNGSKWGTEGEIKIEGGFKYKGIAYAGIPETLVFHDAMIDQEAAYAWADIPQNVGGSFALYNGGVFAGSGGITIHRVNDVDIKRVDIWFQFDDTDFIPSDSELYYDVTLYASPIDEYYSQFNLDSGGHSYNTQNVLVSLESGANGGTFASWATGANSYVEYDYYGHFINEYNITLSGAIASTVITRDGLGQQLSSSKFKLKNSTGSIVYQPSSYSTTNSTHNHDNGSYYYYLDVENYGDVLIYEGMGSAPSHAGDIEFNQTFYTDPEDIEVSWDVDSFDSDAYTYEIQIITSVSGNPSQDSWPADGNWNTSPFISSASGAAVFDFYSDGYDLPIWIQGELWAQDKSSGTWTKLDNTPAVIYHEKSDIGVGSIWTEKNSYNLSEMFYIFVETDYPIVEIELISDTYHDIQSLEVFEGGWQRVGYAFFSPHNFTAYLYEGGVITNQTSFSVWTTSPMLNIFLDSEALKTQFAFEFYTDNSSDTITGYKPDGSIFYGPITDLETGDRNIIRGVSSSSPPGIYTISLFHDGTTYYNDTIELYSTSEWVYFDASKYETGDRIKIHSFVTDSRQEVRLSDSIGTAVITWTDSAGYIIPNSQTVLYFSLTDNNEYGMNVNTSIDAGTFQTGNWKVEIIGIDGKPLTNESTYDYTTVSKKIESPADTSNEMISIFFSPEGAFMLYTVCLTMMGLVLAKHPAGGGAGATVGVGFGVYFNVLPPWMLMLTVILLVVLGGVSVAAYYRGK